MKRPSLHQIHGSARNKARAPDVQAHMRRRLLPLALASSLFGLITGVVGWFWCQLFANPLIGLAAEGHGARTAACAVLAGVVAGLLLAPACGDDGLPARPSPARITVVVLASGASAGGLAVALHAPEDVGLGLGYGFLCAIPLVPAAALAIAILRRAGRARRGSIVARSDARALIATAAGVLGCSTGLALFDWPAAAADVAAPPHGAMLLLTGAAALVLGALVADLIAAARVERWAFRIAFMDDAPAEIEALPAGRVDLGLGNEIAAPTAPGTAYRGGGRPLTCVLGDSDDALAALRQSVRRGVALLALLEAVGIAHGIARGTDAAAHYSAWLCDEVSSSACRDAALLAERAGLPGSDASRLHGRACETGQGESCLAIDLLKRLERTTQ
jgi:hypothetical protein